MPDIIQDAIDALQMLEPEDVRTLDDDTLTTLEFWIQPIATLVEHEQFRRRCAASRALLDADTACPDALEETAA